MSARMEFLHVAKRKQDKWRLSLITSIHRVSLQCAVLHVCFGNGSERIYSHIYCFCKVCHRLYYYICLMVNRMNTDRLIMLTPIYFLSSWRTFMFEVMEMKTFFIAFLIQLFSIFNFVCFRGALECVKAYPYYTHVQRFATMWKVSCQKDYWKSCRHSYIMYIDSVSEFNHVFQKDWDMWMFYHFWHDASIYLYHESFQVHERYSN
jgi:hypothetical protein